MEKCPVCGGPAVILGTLGSRIVFRCRNSGTEWLTSAGPDDANDADEPFDSEGERDDG